MLTPVSILDRAVMQGASPEVIEKLMGLQERWEANQARKAFALALAAAKPKFPEIIKDNPVDQGKGRPKYKFADLPAICRAVDPHLHDNGLSYRWRTVTGADRWITVTCILSHAQGYSEESSLSAPPDTTGAKNSAQSQGSTVTYLSRYTLLAALGLAPDIDDDGRGGRQTGEIVSDAVVTPEQAEEIKALALDTLGEDELVRFWATVGAPEQIPASEYVRVLRTQRAHKQRAAEEKQRNQQKPVEPQENAETENAP
jgi:hypothetical protein